MKKTNRITSLFISLTLIFQQTGFAQMAASLDVGKFMGLTQPKLVSTQFRPLHLRYFSYDALNNEIKVLLDKGDAKVDERQAQESARSLLRYFLIGITVPDDAFWVNLRPDIQDKIIDPLLAETDVGKIMLEADVQLKKDTALATSPQTPEGKVYWEKLYKKAGELFGADNITIPTLTRPWIVPNEVIIRESNDSVYVYKATMKVMLEQDHLKDSADYTFDDPRMKALNEYSSQLIRELIIPKLNKMVNTSKSYAPLRQVFYSLVLARWFKARYSGKSGLYPSMINRSNLTGLASAQAWSKTTYFNEYQKSFKSGEYNLSVPVTTMMGQVIRNYFSGGADFTAKQLQITQQPISGSSPVVSGFMANRNLLPILAMVPGTMVLSAVPAPGNVVPMLSLTSQASLVTASSSPVAGIQKAPTVIAEFTHKGMEEKRTRGLARDFFSADQLTAIATWQTPQRVIAEIRVNRTNHDGHGLTVHVVYANNAGDEIIFNQVKGSAVLPLRSIATDALKKKVAVDSSSAVAASSPVNLARGGKIDVSGLRGQHIEAMFAQVFAYSSRGKQGVFSEALDELKRILYPQADKLISPEDIANENKIVGFLPEILRLLNNVLAAQLNLKKQDKPYLKAINDVLGILELAQVFAELKGKSETSSSASSPAQSPGQATQQQAASVGFWLLHDVPTALMQQSPEFKVFYLSVDPKDGSCLPIPDRKYPFDYRFNKSSSWGAMVNDVRRRPPQDIQISNPLFNVFLTMSPEITMALQDTYLVFIPGQAPVYSLTRNEIFLDSSLLVAGREKDLALRLSALAKERGLVLQALTKRVSGVINPSQLGEAVPLVQKAHVEAVKFIQSQITARQAAPGKPAASSPLTADDVRIGQVVTRILTERVEPRFRALFGKTKAEAERIDPALARISFDGNSNRLGWNMEGLQWLLDHPEAVEGVVNDAQRIDKDYDYVIFAGMGGSGLSVQTVKTTFGPQDYVIFAGTGDSGLSAQTEKTTFGEDKVVVFSLRTTDPSAIKEILDEIARCAGSLQQGLSRTLVIPISKSGTTEETVKHKKYFEDLFRKRGMLSSKHMWVITDKGSPFDTGEYEQREIQFNDNVGRYGDRATKGDIGGRFTAPTTNIFLLPLALAVQDKDRIMRVLRAAQTMNSEVDVAEDQFVRLAAFLYYYAAQKGKDKVTLLVPDSLREFPLWAEQLIEESLGKDGKGVTIFYGEKLAQEALRVPDASDRVFVRINVGDTLTNNELWRDLVQSAYPTFELNVDSIDSLGGLMLGFQRTVADIAYLWGINFVNQPEVQGYKTATTRVMNALNPGERVAVPSAWKFVSSGSLKLYLTPLYESGAITEEQLRQEVERMGQSFTDMAAVYAAILNLLSNKPGFEAGELISYGRMGILQPLLEEVRAKLFTQTLQLPCKLGEGPDKNHSYHQNVKAGRNMWFSTYLLNLNPQQPSALPFDDNLIKAQAIGTVQDLAAGKRKVVLITTNALASQARDDYEDFFARVSVYMGLNRSSSQAAASSPVAVVAPLSVSELRNPENIAHALAWMGNNKYIFGGGFGYDIRINDAVTDSQDTIAFHYAVGRTFGGKQYLNGRGRALVTGDQRSTSLAFRKALVQGLADEGIEVVTQSDEDVITTALTSRKGLADEFDLVI
ncbi:MAG: hypothetical protein KBA46_05820 [Candidatus Omnitrophica bacterium]|nr:hypothetical protein [Candidatus Omnitrophota bacterium]